MRNNLFIGAALAALVAPVSVQAQETTSSIRGVVTRDGVPVAGASITAELTTTGSRSNATTGDDGSFTISGLRPGGPYTISVNGAEYQVTDIFTVVAQPYDLPIDIASGADEIVVTAAAVVGARTLSQGPATLLTAEQIQNVATVNRDIRDLMRRDPFARLQDTPGGGRAVSFAGQNARFNRFSVDGVAITDNFGLNPDGLPSRRSPIPLDAIGQFQTRVAPYDVREGNFQGGAINIVLKSGTNDFSGTGFYAYSGDELFGKETKPGPGVPTGRISLPNFEIINYGAQLAGPIIKDRLFFMVAGERIRAGRPIPEGPIGGNAGTEIPTLTQAQVNSITQIARDRYGYSAGGVVNDNQDRDDRLVAKLDANLSDTQRASLTYTYAEDSIILTNNTSANPGAPSLGLSSNAYRQGNRLHTGVFQLNSEWSDSFSTEARGFYKNYRRIQDPLEGRGFAEFTVCAAPTSDRTNPAATGAGAGASINCAPGFARVSFGPDVSRQFNALSVESFGGLLQARVTLGDHDVRVFGEYQHVKTFNAFLSNSSNPRTGVTGAYYFDSIADFQAGTAQRFGYINSVTLNPDDAAAQFNYDTFTVGVQDTWRITDNLTFSYGFRWDSFGGDSRPVLNPNFVDRVGYANTNYISGLQVFQPRFGIDWKPTSRLSIRGGLGIFSGGTPDVYVSNSFSNTGIASNQIDIIQQNNGTFSGATTSAAVANQILTNVNGATIPAAANQLIQNAATSTTSPVNALVPDFKIPSQWRATASVDWDADLGPLGDGWQLGADFFYSAVRNQVLFTDARSVPTALRTPDGRIRYRSLTTGTSQDIVLANTRLGRSYIGVGRIRKAWDFGLEAGVSYIYQDVKDQAPATSSTAGSNYSNGAFLDPNIVAYGTSNDEVRHQFKYDLTFSRALFGDYKTTIALFGETRIGQPFSYTFQDTGSGRSPIFGTGGSNTRYLLYVPTGLNDPLVSYDSSAFATQFDQFIESSGLRRYRGRVAPRNAFNSRWFTRIDLHLEQEFPAPFLGGKSRFAVFADIENFTNFLNKNWGQIREFGFPYNAVAARVQCLQAPTPTGTAGTAVTSTAQPCAQYRYTAPNSPPTDTIYSAQSLYSIRVGARFSF